MTGHSPHLAALVGRLAQGGAITLALAFILFADFPTLALPGVLALFFAVYVWMRLMVFLENDRFSPRRLRVSLTWALVGIDSGTNEFDPRPVRVYFSLLTLLFAGLVLRPIAQAVF